MQMETQANAGPRGGKKTKVAFRISEVERDMLHEEAAIEYLDPSKWARSVVMQAVEGTLPTADAPAGQRAGGARHVTFPLRVSVEQRAAIEAAAAREHLEVQPWLRKTVLREIARRRAARARS